MGFFESLTMKANLKSSVLLMRTALAFAEKSRERDEPTDFLEGLVKLRNGFVRTAVCITTIAGHKDGVFNLPLAYQIMETAPKYAEELELMKQAELYLDAYAPPQLFALENGNFKYN